MDGLQQALKKAAKSGDIIGLVSDFSMARFLLKELSISRCNLIWINEDKPHSVMGVDFDEVFYQEKPRSKECLAICLRRVHRKDGNVNVPDYTNIEAYPKGIAQRMKHY